MNNVFEVWGSELEPLYMLDLGDRLLNLGLWHIRGRASEVPLEQELAQLVTLRNGLVIRDQTFSAWEDGLRAAGLERDAIIPQLAQGPTRHTEPAQPLRGLPVSPSSQM